MKKSAGAPLHVNSLAELHQIFILPPPAHPLISLLDLDASACPVPAETSGLVFNFYSLWFKQGVSGELRYGQGTYDLSHGTMLFLAPGQVLATQGHRHTSGWGLAFHPALLRGHALGTRIRDYGFFSYASHEVSC